MVPGSVAFENPVEVAEPGIAVAAVFGAVEEDDVEDFGEMGGVFLAFGKAIDEGIAIGLGEEGLQFVLSGDAAEEVEVKASGEGGVVGIFGGSDVFLVPFLRDELVDDLSWREGRVGEDEFDGRFDFEGGNPVVEGVDLVGGKLLFGRHVGIGADLDGLEERAFFGIAGEEGGVGFATFDGGANGAEVEATFLFHAAVALGAVVDDDGMDFAECRHAEAEEKNEDGVGRWHGDSGIIRSLSAKLSSEVRGSRERRGTKAGSFDHSQRLRDLTTSAASCLEPAGV